jgi:hypothetical protein
MRRSRLLERLDGPPLPLPSVLDRLSERWWSLPPRWRSTLVLVAVAATVLLGLSHAAATPYGPPTSVMVATRDLPAGHELERGDLRRVTWPQELVPPDPLGHAEGRLAAALPEGSVATSRHVAAEGAAAALPHGMVAVPVPGEAMPALTVGSRVDVIGRDLDGRALVLARGGSVLAMDGTEVWLAVPEANAPEVAAAGASGLLTVVVLPP